MDSLSSSERDCASMATGSSAVGIVHGRSTRGLSGLGQRVAGLRAGQPADRGDVTGDHARRRHLVLAERVRQRADALVLVVVLVTGAVGEEGGEVPRDVHRASGVRVPEKTRTTLTRPTYWSLLVRTTSATSGPSGSQVTGAGAGRRWA